MEQHEQSNGHGRNQHIIRYRGPRDQPPILRSCGEVGECHPQSDKHHHLDQRDRDQDIDRPIKRHLSSSPAQA